MASGLFGAMSFAEILTAHKCGFVQLLKTPARFSSSAVRRSMYFCTSLVIFKSMALHAVLKRLWTLAGRSRLKRRVDSSGGFSDFSVRTGVAAGRRATLTLATGFASCPAPPCSKAAIASGDGWFIAGFGAALKVFLVIIYDFTSQLFDIAAGDSRGIPLEDGLPHG